ncbi:hypothetical protein ANCDUO_20125, partial [Ancylostoma duodenale]
VGSVQLVNLNNMSESASLSPRGIDAHLTEVTQLALNNQATLLATGSAKGTCYIIEIPLSQLYHIEI